MGTIQDELKKIEKKVAKNNNDDPFALLDIESLKQEAEDIEKARLRAEEEEKKEAERKERIIKFSQEANKIQDLVAWREANRNISPTNYAAAEKQISQLLSYADKDISRLAKTAYILACVKKEGGIAADFLFEDIKEKGLVKPDEKGVLRIDGKLHSLTFDAGSNAGQIYDALRMRAGEIERVKTQKRRDAEKRLRLAGKLSIWDIFDGKEGTCSVYVPFHTVKVKEGEKKVRPGLFLIESDGKKIVCQGGSGGQEKLAKTLNEKGIAVYLAELRKENYYSKRPEDGIKIVFHRRLWQARNFAAERGGEPTTTNELRAELARAQTIETARLIDGETGTAFFCYGPGSWEIKKGEYSKKYTNVFVLVERTADGGVYYKEWPRHLDFMFSPYKEVNLEGGNIKKGPGLSFWKWAKGHYKNIPAHLQETKEQKKARQNAETAIETS
jgi:hypothetical protein